MTPAAPEHWEKAIAIYHQLRLPDAAELRDELSTMDVAKR
jgi:hypothetical protein